MPENRECLREKGEGSLYYKLQELELPKWLQTHQALSLCQPKHMSWMELLDKRTHTAEYLPAYSACLNCNRTIHKPWPSPFGLWFGPSVSTLVSSLPFYRSAKSPRSQTVLWFRKVTSIENIVVQRCRQEHNVKHSLFCLRGSQSKLRRAADTNASVEQFLRKANMK